MGAVIAELFSEHGAMVTVNDVDAKLADECVARLRAIRGRFIAAPGSNIAWQQF